MAVKSMNLDAQPIWMSRDPRDAAEIRQASWLVSYMPLAPTAALDAAGVLRHNRGVEIVFNTTDINPQPPSHWFQP